MPSPTSPGRRATTGSPSTGRRRFEAIVDKPGMKDVTPAPGGELGGHPNGPELRSLLVEDSPADAELCQRELRRAGLRFTARCVDTRPAFESALKDFDPDLVLSDFSMPTSFDGLMALDLT